VEFAYPLDLVAVGDDARRLKVQLNGPFDYQHADGKIAHMDAEKDPWEDTAALLALRYANIERAHISTTSVLRIEFDGGQQLTAAPDGKYEGWEVVGPGFYIVGAPDGPAIRTGKAWDQ
jgi:Family of unknown function (DUF6188)